MHEGSTNPRLKQELRSATGLALRAGKVAAQSLGKAMSTGVVQERHLWLCLVERSDVDKVSFLDTLISQAWLFGDTVEDCAQQFSAVQKQTEATHLAPAWCTAPPQSKTQSACRRGRPPVPSRVREQVSSGSAPCWIVSRCVEPLAGARRPLCSSWPLYRPERRWSGPDTGNPEMWEPAWSQEMARTAPLLPPKEGRGRIIHSVPPLAQGPAVPSLSSKSNSLSSEFSGPRVDSVRRIASSLSPATHFASGQESAVRGRSTSPRTSSQSLQGLREFCEDESERRAFCTIQPYSHSLHHCGYVDCAVGATCTASGGVACAAQPVSLAHAHNSTRLRDSVRQATSQVQRRSRDCGGSSECSCLARGDCCPPGKDAIEPVPPAEMKQGFYSPYFIVPKKDGGLRPILDCDSWTGPCTGSRLRCWRTGAWSNAYSPGIGLQRSTWRMLTFMFRSFRDTDRSTVCVWGSGMAVQGPPLRALPVRPCLHEDRGGCPCPVTGSGHQDPQLSRAWPARENSYAITGTWCFGTSASWGFRSTGKRASSPLRRESLFSVWS